MIGSVAKILVTGISCLYFATTSSAQLFDSIAASFQYKPKFALKLDTRNSFITQQVARVRGIKVGLNFNNTTQFGIGVNWLASDFSKLRTIRTNEGIKQQEVKLRYWFISPYFEYAFYRTRRWDVSVPIQLGFGSSLFHYENEQGEQVRVDRGGIIVYEPAMTTIYKPVVWAGVGLGIGYRISLLNNKNIGETFNSPTYTVKLNVYFGELYRILAPKT